MPRIRVADPSLPAPMRLRRFRVENFKNLHDAEFHFNSDLNILTGVNNSGKTTVLEAIALWAECFRKIIRRTDKGSSAKGLRQGDYWFGREHNYFDNDALKSIRCPRPGEIFHALDTDTIILLEAVCGRDDDPASDITIGFTIRAGRGEMYDILLKNWKTFDYAAFNERFQAFPMPVTVIYASPVAFLAAREDFETLPKRRSRMFERASIQVLRNRLYQLKKDAPRYNDFMMRLSGVLSENKTPLEFFIEGEEADDVEVVVRVQVGPKDIRKDISLLGSGTLQIIEILLGLHEVERGFSGMSKDLNIVLLDEPDSHIHRDIQRRLLNTLSDNTKNCQVFLTTHNESIIRTADPKHVFHLEQGRSGAYHPIDKDDVASKRIGLQPSRQLNVLTTLGNESALDFLNALEADHLLLVEGEDDARFLQAIVEGQVSPRQSFRAMYWSFGGIDALLSNIGTYRQVFDLFRNHKSLWDKATIVLDADFLTDDQRKKLVDEMPKKLGNRPVYCWSSYTIESTVLANPDKLSSMVRELLRKELPGYGLPDDGMVVAAVQKSCDALEARLRQRLEASDNTYFLKVNGQLQQRKRSLEVLGLGHIIGKENFWWKNFQDYARRMLDAKRLDALSTKDDVLEVLRDVYASLSLVLDETNIMHRFIHVASFSSRPDQWNEIGKKLLGFP